MLKKNRSTIWYDRFLLLLLLFCLLITPGRGLAGTVKSADHTKLPISIFVSIGAHLDFCREIGAGRVAVKLALPPGKSPATYAPTPAPFTGDYRYTKRDCAAANAK